MILGQSHTRATLSASPRLPPPAFPPPPLGALLLTHLLLDGVRLPDASDGLQEATLTFCLRYDQTPHFIPQVFQSTPEPTGLLRALARMGRQVRSPGQLGEGLVGGPGDGGTADDRCSLWGFAAARRAGEASAFLFSGRPSIAFSWPQTAWVAQTLHSHARHNRGPWMVQKLGPRPLRGNTKTVLITQDLCCLAPHIHHHRLLQAGLGN